MWFGATDFAVIETEEGEMCITDTLQCHLTLTPLGEQIIYAAKTVVSHLCRLGTTVATVRSTP